MDSFLNRYIRPSYTRSQTHAGRVGAAPWWVGFSIRQMGQTDGRTDGHRIDSRTLSVSRGHSNKDYTVSFQNSKHQ